MASRSISTRRDDPGDRCRTGEPIELRVHTELPVGRQIEVEVVRRSGGAEWTLSLRVPAWAAGAMLDGVPVAPGGYVR